MQFHLTTTQNLPKCTITHIQQKPLNSTLPVNISRSSARNHHTLQEHVKPYLAELYIATVEQVQYLILWTTLTLTVTVATPVESNVKHVHWSRYSCSCLEAAVSQQLDLSLLLPPGTDCPIVTQGGRLSCHWLSHLATVFQDLQLGHVWPSRLTD